MPVVHKFPNSTPPAGGVNQTTSANWNDGHLSKLVSTAYSASGSIPAWSAALNSVNVELVEATGTITLTLPPASGSGMNVRFINVGSGVITITDGGSFTHSLVNPGQTAHVYDSTAAAAWKVLGNS